MTIISGKKHLVWRLLCSDFLSNLATSLAAKIAPGDFSLPFRC